MMPLAAGGQRHGLVARAERAGRHQPHAYQAGIAAPLEPAGHEVGRAQEEEDQRGLADPVRAVQHDHGIEREEGRQGQPQPAGAREEAQEGPHQRHGSGHECCALQ